MGSVGTKTDEMNVPYDEWGPEISKEIGDGEYLEDRQETRYESVIKSVDKDDLLGMIATLKNKDNTYGDDDTAAYVQYENGDFLDLTDGEKHGRWSKKNIVGLYYSDTEGEAVWGGNYVTRNGQRVLEPLTVADRDTDDGKTYENSLFTYRPTGIRYVRTKIKYNNERETTDYRGNKTTTYYTTRETVRKSKWKEVR